MRTTATLAIGMSLALSLALAGTSTASAGSASAESVSARARPSLTMTPATGYLPGSDLTLRGTLGRSGRHAIVVQRHLGRDGDRWIDIHDTRTRTRPNGSFTVHAPASGMNGISYRVAGASSSAATPPVAVNAAVQETLVTATSDRAYGVSAGAPITFSIDTTVASGTFAASPPIVGRGLALQQRVDGFRWATVATSSTDAQGDGRFVAAAPTTPGTAVYRVRQEDWHVGRDRIGWHASHPVYVDVLHPAAPDVRPAARKDAAASSPLLPRRAATSRRTAGSTNSWGNPVSDWDWEYGESLTTPATRGTRLRGWWSDYSDGTGRAAVRNGAVLLSSANEHSRRTPSLGSTSITLNANARRLGRWETRILPNEIIRGSSPMGVRVELVPTSSASRQCSATGIVLADYSPTSSRVSFGVRTSRQWTRTVRTGANNAVARAFAVEVGRKHITWFIDGRPVGTLRKGAARPQGQLTMRVSLLGTQSGTDNRTKLGVDWVRTWTLDRGKQVKRKRHFSETANRVTC